MPRCSWQPLESKVDNVDTFQNTTGDEVNTLTGRMNEYDLVSTNFANQMQAVQAEQTKGLTDMRAGLDKIFSQTGAFTTLSNLVEYNTKTIKGTRREAEVRRCYYYW